MWARWHLWVSDILTQEMVQFSEEQLSHSMVCEQWGEAGCSGWLSCSEIDLNMVCLAA